jgi:hypothetical protein
MAEPKDQTAEADSSEATPAVTVAPPPALASAPKAEAPEVVAEPAPVPVKAPAPKAPAPVKAATPKAATPAPKAKPPRKPVSRRKPIASRKPAAPAIKATPRPAAAPTKTHTVSELKEKIMATKTSTTFPSGFPGFPADFSGMGKSMSDAVAEMQGKAQEAYDKGTGMVSEMTDLAKGNVEAIVESGKIMAAGIQDMGKTYADEAKSAYETITADLKEMAGVKSPTELFQLQGKIMRRNFDLLVATGTKGSEGAMKLANDVIAPISARVNLAVDKLSKAA